MKVNWIDEKDNIEKLITEGVSYERIGRQYGVTGASVKKAAKKLGIELEQKRIISPNEHFNKGKKTVHKCLNCGKEIDSKNKYCSNKCQNEHQYDEKIKKWKNNPDNFKSEWGYNFIKKYLLEKYNNKCEICGWGIKNEYTNNIPLEIHHIDGDCTNNKEENLQLLCPNCHSLTENFGSRNKASKRYKLKKYKQGN
jgi:predicted RNA-binding Zn-ribbon protein involved in translation (DUF1610 family)